MRIFKKKEERKSINIMDLRSRGEKTAKKDTPKPKTMTFPLKWRFEGESRWREKTITITGTSEVPNGDMYEEAYDQAEGILFAQSLIGNVEYRVLSGWGLNCRGRIQKK